MELILVNLTVRSTGSASSYMAACRQERVSSVVVRLWEDSVRCPIVFMRMRTFWAQSSMNCLYV
jgi:hypothetical protein